MAEPVRFVVDAVYACVIFIWGVMVLELDSYHDNNKEPDPYTHLVHAIRPINFN